MKNKPLPWLGLQDYLDRPQDKQRIHLRVPPQLMARLERLSKKLKTTNLQHLCRVILEKACDEEGV